MTLCASCGQENPPIAKFCLACGAPLQAAETPREERRLVTALFTDIVGSTATAEQLDPEDVHARLMPYFDRVRREIERFGGVVEKYVGDAVVALFGAPVAHEDDPERAVRAALAIKDAIAALNAGDDWLELEFRIGVNTGEALVLLGPNPTVELGMTAGDVMNTSARIQSAAPVNGVLVGELTYRATRNEIEYRDHEPVSAKGKAEPVKVWEAAAVRVVAERTHRRTKLVGRTAELERLLAVFEQARTERLPGLATLMGPPGIGKSRLLEELKDRVAETADVHSGRCLSYGEGITYWPLEEIFKEAAGIVQNDESEQIRAKLGALLERTGSTDAAELRTIAAAVSNLMGEEASPRGTYSTSEITQAELHWGLRRLLQLLARQQPMVLVFEDLHWAEPTLLEFVQFLVEDEPDTPLLVVGSARPEFVDVGAGLVRDGTRAVSITLEPLGDEAGAELLAELVGSEALAGAPEAAALLRNAGGNPLFVEETVQMLREAGMVDEDGWHVPAGEEELPVPTNLQSLISSRLDQLRSGDRFLAQHASVIGSVFWPGAVTYLESSVADTMADGLTALERRDLVHEQAPSTVAGEREYGFKHILIRDVAYGKLPKRRRVELHMRCSEWVRALPGEDDFVEIVAWHLERACRLASEVARSPIPPPTLEAAAAFVRAGEKAERHGGTTEAERFYARALDLVDPQEEVALDLRLRRGSVLQRLGRVQEAQDLLLPLAEEALARDRPDVRSEALGHLAQIDQRQGRPGKAVERLEQALQLAVEIGDRRLEIRAMYARASASGDVGGGVEALDDLLKAIGIAEEIDDRTLRVEGHLRAGFLLGNRGDFAAAEEQLERCSTLAAALGSSRDQARATHLLARIKYLRGHRAEAELLGVQAQEWLDRTGETYFQIQNLVALAEFALANDDPIVAEARLQVALPLALAEGNWLVADVYRYLAEALVRQGRIDDARELVQFAVKSVPEGNAWAQATVGLAEAAVAAAAGDFAQAAERYDYALEVIEGLNSPIDLCQARIAYARALRGAGDLVGARGQLEPAAEVCRSMGADGLLVEIERELELVGSGAG